MLAMREGNKCMLRVNYQSNNVLSFKHHVVKKTYVFIDMKDMLRLKSVTPQWGLGSDPKIDLKKSFGLISLV